MCMIHKLTFRYQQCLITKMTFCYHVLRQINHNVSVLSWILCFSGRYADTYRLQSVSFHYLCATQSMAPPDRPFPTYQFLR